MQEQKTREIHGDGNLYRREEKGLPLPRLSNNPLVTVITANYNFGSYLEETILSVLRQDYHPLELVIIDGASRDNSLGILRKYESDRRVRWFSEPDRGHMDALNKGLRLARGELIGILHSTDTYQPGAVRQAVEEFVSDPDLAFAGGFVQVVDDSGFTTGEIWRFPEDRTDIAIDDILGFKNLPGIQATFLRRDLALAIGGFYREGCHTNLFLHYMLEASIRGMRCRRIPKVWGNFRVHPSPARGLDKGSRYYRDRKLACRENAKRYRNYLTVEQIRLLYRSAYLFEYGRRVTLHRQLLRTLPPLLGYLWHGGGLAPLRDLKPHPMNVVNDVELGRMLLRFPRLVDSLRYLKGRLFDRHGKEAPAVKGSREAGKDTRWYLESAC